MIYTVGLFSTRLIYRQEVEYSIRMEESQTTKVSNGAEYPPRETFVVFVNNFEGKKQQFHLRRENSLADLKTQISSYTGVHPNQFILTYNGRHLGPESGPRSLPDLGISDMAVLQMTRKCIGGGDQL